MMRKRNILTVMLVFTMFFTLTGCGNNSSESNSGENNQTTENNTNAKDSKTKNQERNSKNTAETNGKTLVVYFSYSGNTKQVAENIQKKLNADIFEIKTVKDYSSDYDTLIDEAQEEQNDNARPELSTKIDNIEQYDTIIIGHPIWWGDMPMAVYTFLDTYDLSGKTIASFCTHGGSGLSGTDKKIQDEEKNATVLEGLAISDSSIDSSDSDVESWLQECGIRE